MSASKQQSDNSSSPPRCGRPPFSTLNPPPLCTLLPRPLNESNSCQEYVPLPPRQRVSRPIARNKRNRVPPIDAQQILIDDFNCRKHDTMTFPLKLSDSTTRAVVKQFQLHFAEVASDLEHVCTSCGLFIPVAEVTRLHCADLIFQKGISFNAFSEEGLDICGQNGNHFYFCQSCVNDIQKSKPPRFGYINGINTYTCHSYPESLKDLTLVEEAVITRAHPIISIIKLRPSGASVSASYSRIRGHAVVLSQQSGPLLNLLPSNDIQLHDIIRVVWLGKRPPNDNNLRYFGRIRKAKVLEALLWLKNNNALYKDIVINFDLTNTWDGSLCLPVFQAGYYNVMKIYRKEKVM